jgi:hypothetical protein
MVGVIDHALKTLELILAGSTEQLFLLKPRTLCRMLQVASRLCKLKMERRVRATFRAPQSHRMARLSCRSLLQM